jgi:hypothetical protein
VAQVAEEEVSDQDEPAPDVPYVLTISWSIGDSLVLEYPDLLPWEARAVLEEAIEQIRADMQSDSESEEAT